MTFLISCYESIRFKAFFGLCQWFCVLYFPSKSSETTGLKALLQFELIVVL